MKLHSKILSTVITLACLALMGPFASADENTYPIAIFPFTEKGTGLNGYGQKIGDVLFSHLVTNDSLYLVDREDLKLIMDEAELNLSGMVNQQQMIQVGQLSGAKILVTGSIFEVDGNLVMVAKIIGTETGRLFGASVKGGVDDDLFAFTGQMSEKITDIIETKSSQLIAPITSRSDRQKVIKEIIAGKSKPSVAVDISERHVNRNTIDPAAETEIVLFLTELGFEVFEWDGESVSNADVRIKGEGFSELAARQGNINSVKARLEVRAVDSETSRLIAIERQNEVEVDLSEQFAGKKALQEAAAAIAERLIPKIVDSHNR